MVERKRSNFSKSTKSTKSKTKVDKSIKQSTKDSGNSNQNINTQTIKIVLPPTPIKKKKKKSSNAGKKKAAIEQLKSDLEKFTQLKNLAKEKGIKLPAELGESPTNMENINSIAEIVALSTDIETRNETITRLLQTPQKPNIVSPLYGGTFAPRIIPSPPQPVIIPTPQPAPPQPAPPQPTPQPAPTPPQPPPQDDTTNDEQIAKTLKEIADAVKNKGGGVGIDTSGVETPPQDDNTSGIEPDVPIGNTTTPDVPKGNTTTPEVPIGNTTTPEVPIDNTKTPQNRDDTPGVDPLIEDKTKFRDILSESLDKTARQNAKMGIQGMNKKQLNRARQNEAVRNILNNQLEDVAIWKKQAEFDISKLDPVEDKEVIEDINGMMKQRDTLFDSITEDLKILNRKRMRIIDPENLSGGDAPPVAPVAPPADVDAGAGDEGFNLLYVDPGYPVQPRPPQLMKITQKPLKYLGAYTVDSYNDYKDKVNKSINTPPVADREDVSYAITETNLNEMEQQRKIRLDDLNNFMKKITEYNNNAKINKGKKVNISQARKQIIDATKKVLNVPTAKLIRAEVNSLKPNATIGIYNDEGIIIRLLE
jgi:hypothetical protein